jgi:hypothetical protein
MIRHCLRALRISRKRRSWYLELLGQPLDEGLDRLLQLRERNAGIAQECELNGEADSVGIPAAFSHQVQVSPRKGKASRHTVWVKRYPEESLALLVGQQLSARQGVSPVPKILLLIMDGAALGDVFCGRLSAVKPCDADSVQRTTVLETP